MRIRTPLPLGKSLRAAGLAAWLVLGLWAQVPAASGPPVGEPPKTGQTPNGPSPLSLAQAVSAALEGHPAIAAQRASQDVAAAKGKEARAGYLPKVNYSESWMRSDNPVFVFSSLLTQRQFTAGNFALGPLNRPDFLNNFQSRLTAEQTLYDGGRTQRAVAGAKLGQQLRADELVQLRAQLAAQVVRLYVQAQVADAMVGSAGQSLRSAEAGLQQAEARLQAGMATELDLLSLRVHVAEVKEEQILRESQRQIALAALNEAMGLPLDSVRELSTPLQPMQKAALAGAGSAVGSLESQALAQRAEVRLAKAARTIAELQHADTKANFLPQVALQGAWEADRQNPVTRGGANWLVGVGLRWNLFNGYADQAKREGAIAGVRHAAAEEGRITAAVRLAVRQAAAEHAAAQQRLATTQSAITMAEESLRISQNRYSAGLLTVTELLRAETALRQTRTRHLAALGDQRIAAALLELALGALSANSEVLQ